MADESPSSPPSKVAGLSQSDTAYLATMFVCPKGDSKFFDVSSVNFDTLANILGYKDAGSARVRWHRLSRKLSELGGKNVSGGVKKIVKREAKSKKVATTKANAKARDDDEGMMSYEKFMAKEVVKDEDDIVAVKNKKVKAENLKVQGRLNEEVEEGEYE